MEPVRGDEPLRIGMTEVDITPPHGFLMAGYYHERRATGALDPLKAKAIVFREGSTQAAWVACDLTGIAVDLSREVRRQVAERTGIPAEHVIVSATHSHTAPDYTRDLYEYLVAIRSGSKPPDTYAEKLIGGMVQAVVDAHAKAEPVSVEAGSGTQVESVSFNRRFVMRDGSVRTWMRLDNPDVVRAAGPIDPEIGLLRIRDADSDQTLGLCSNFALHLDTVGGTLWSADYPFHVEQSLRQSLGEKLISIFGTGCCGDINHVDPLKKERNPASRIGQSLANTMIASLPRLTSINRSRLRVRHAIVELPLQEVSAEQVAAAQPRVLEARAGKQVEFFALVTAYKSLMLDQIRNKTPLAKTSDFLSWGLTHHWSGVGSTLPVEVQVIALGNDAAMVFLPGEVFVDLGLAIKQASPFKTTLLVELSNCVETVYIPHRAAYAGGSYEVTNSTLQAGSGEQLVEGAIRLLREVASEDR
jgi:hypothetical protein